MSTSLPLLPLPDISQHNVRVAIITAEWNTHITHALRDSACRCLDDNGVGYDLYDVPGAVELTYAAARMLDRYSAVIVFGCVVRGGTPHFDYVCQSVTQGVTALNSYGTTPVIFGVLTVDNEQDAIDRTGGPMGDKGKEAAECAIKMIAFACSNPK